MNTALAAQLRQARVYDLEQPRPRELVPRRDRIEVAERLSGRGEVLTPLTEEEIERVVAEVAERQPAAVAVSFLFSYLDSRHEDALAGAYVGECERWFWRWDHVVLSLSGDGGADG